MKGDGVERSEDTMGAEGGRPDLSVLVCTLNVRELTLTCVQRVLERHGRLDVEVIVVDNASRDGTVEALRARFPEIRVVANRGNAGFSRANNQALALARGRHVLFLNPDTEVGEGTLERCVAALDADPTLGMVGCRMMYPDGRVQYEGGRRDYRLHHLVWEAFYLQVLFPSHPLFAHELMGDWDHRDERDVEAIIGAFMLCRTELAREIGGLPEDIFLYHEDLSFCLRIRQRGWRIRYLGEVETIHHHGATTSKLDSPLNFLEGEVRVRLIHERSGALAALAARGLMLFRSVMRLGIAGGMRLVPRVGPFRALEDLEARRPRAFAFRPHLFQLAWSVAPWTVRRLIPGPDPDSEPVDLPYLPPQVT